ncbi:hypothetical protein G5V59_12995 [Nocardioides sp. W3-2-3]|uniref:hypothetical protein n=1 Tax=Nocardioides convexus TaxID=2712224 RepID=UPI0024185C00|nr:hypothetical protein [Nocardioides convexus]NHA00631.1 hypothetical protein [Nocardioides convexus]
MGQGVAKVGAEPEDIDELIDDDVHRVTLVGGQGTTSERGLPEQPDQDGAKQRGGLWPQGAFAERDKQDAPLREDVAQAEARFGLPEDSA